MAACLVGLGKGVGAATFAALRCSLYIKYFTYNYNTEASDLKTSNVNWGFPNRTKKNKKISTQRDCEWGTFVGPKGLYRLG